MRLSNKVLFKIKLLQHFQSDNRGDIREVIIQNDENIYYYDSKGYWSMLPKSTEGLVWDKEKANNDRHISY